GQPVPKCAWFSYGSSRPALVGDLQGIPFLVLADGDGRASICKADSPTPVSLSSMSFADKPVLSRWRDRPVIVKGGLAGIEVVDADTCKSVGRFSKHLDEETLLAAIE